MPSSPCSCTGRLNQGWVYRDRIAGPEAGQSVLDFYARRYTPLQPRGMAGTHRIGDRSAR